MSNLAEEFFVVSGVLLGRVPHSMVGPSFLEEGGNLPFLRYDAVGSESEDVQSAISDKAKVGGSGYGYARVEERGVFDVVAIESLGSEFKHYL